MENVLYEVELYCSRWLGQLRERHVSQLASVEPAVDVNVTKIVGSIDCISNTVSGSDEATGKRNS